MHGRFHQIPPGFIIFQNFLSVSKRFWLVPEGSIGFYKGFEASWLIIMTPIYLPSANNQDLTTAVECVNVVNGVMAPMLILLGVLHQQAWFKISM